MIKLFKQENRVDMKRRKRWIHYGVVFMQLKKDLEKTGDDPTLLIWVDYLLGYVEKQLAKFHKA
tara:strand:+ start:185 stop:376 length:192 start_codon:yes stop_codon:yes gene_type:complete